MTFSTVKPLVPSIKRDDHVHHLQSHVGVQPRLKKHNRVEANVYDRRWPAPDVLPHAEVDADYSKKSGETFEWIHRGQNMNRGVRILRASMLVISLGACAHFRKTPPQPVNTPELPIASDAAADSLLVDVQRVDSSLVVELRYATSNNFTGAPLPGYEGKHAYLRDEAAAALALANEDLRREGFG